ncbi:hypothetical protein, partial [Burkholderia diffusa]|uniref:hypothetical protein n=1 Tax=Burkholderia diffusa TaxID=488732 RepID=UPI001BA9B1EC
RHRGDRADAACDAERRGHRGAPGARRVRALLSSVAARRRTGGQTGARRMDGRGMAAGNIGRIAAGRIRRAVKHHMNGGRDACPGRLSCMHILGPRRGGSRSTQPGFVTECMAAH